MTSFLFLSIFENLCFQRGQCVVVSSYQDVPGSSNAISLPNFVYPSKEIRDPTSRRRCCCGFLSDGGCRRRRHRRRVVVLVVVVVVRDS